MSSVIRDARGAAAIEFALLLPVFLLLVMGCLLYGVYFGIAHGVAQLAADAARASIAGVTDQERTQIAASHVAARTADYPLLETELTSVEAGPASLDMSEFVVTVRYDASAWPVWFLPGIIPSPEKIIMRSASIKRGGY